MILVLFHILLLLLAEVGNFFQTFVECVVKRLGVVVDNEGMLQSFLSAVSLSGINHDKVANQIFGCKV